MACAGGRRPYKAPLVLVLVALMAAVSGAAEWQLTTGTEQDEDPEWSGAKICFSSDRDPSVDFDIWIVEVDESGHFDEWYPRVTTSPTAEDRAPTWDVTGNTLLYFQSKEGTSDWQIYGKATSGSFSFPYTLGNANDRAPDLSSAGGLVYSDRGGNDDIVWINGGGESQGWSTRTTNPANDRDPCWSPDGNWIVFASDRSGNWDIWVMSAGGEGDNLRQLTDTAENETKPAWSPTGGNIVFAREGVGIVAVDPWSRTEFQVTDGATDSSPAWNDDASMIVFTREGVGGQHLWITDNMPPDSPVADLSWGRIKAMYR
jgi:Tol biopolymer transport system component